MVTTPTITSVTAGDTQITFTWSSSYSEFRVYYGSSPDQLYTNAYPTAKSWTVTGLVNGQVWYVAVSAYDELGDESDKAITSAVPFRPDGPATVPGAPSSVTCTPGINQISVSWAAPLSNGGSNITAYRVYYGTSSPATTQWGGNFGSGTNATTITGLTGGTSYYVSVSAINAVGEGTKTTVGPYTAQTTRVPGAPQNLSATFDPASKRLNVSWEANADKGNPELTYYAWVVSGTGITNLSGQVPSTSLSVSIDSEQFAPNITYGVMVSAGNTVGSAGSSVYAKSPSLQPASVIPKINSITELPFAAPGQGTKAGFSVIQLSVGYPQFTVNADDANTKYATCNAIYLLAVCSEVGTDIDGNSVDYKINYPTAGTVAASTSVTLASGATKSSGYIGDDNTSSEIPGINPGRRYYYYLALGSNWGTTYKYANGTAGSTVIADNSVSYVTTATPVINSTVTSSLQYDIDGNPYVLIDWSMDSVTTYVRDYSFERYAMNDAEELVSKTYKRIGTDDKTYTQYNDNVFVSGATKYKYKVTPLTYLWDVSKTTFPNESTAVVYALPTSNYSNVVTLPSLDIPQYVSSVGGNTGFYSNVAYNKVVWQLPQFGSEVTKDNAYYTVYRSEKESDSDTDYAPIAFAYGRDTTYYDGARPVVSLTDYGNYIRPNTPYWYKVVVSANLPTGTGHSTTNFSDLPKVKLTANNFSRLLPNSVGTNGTWKVAAGMKIDTDGYPTLTLKTIGDTNPNNANGNTVAEISENGGPWKVFDIQTTYEASWTTTATKANAGLKFGTNYSMRFRMVDKTTGETTTDGYSNIVNITTYNNDSSSFPNMMPNSGLQYGVVSATSIEDDNELYALKPTGTWVTYKKNFPGSTDEVSTDAVISVISSDNLNYVNGENTFSTSFNCDRALKVNRLNLYSCTDNLSNYKFPNTTLTKVGQTDTKKYAIVGRAVRKDPYEEIGVYHYTFTDTRKKVVPLSWEKKDGTYEENQVTRHTTANSSSIQQYYNYGSNGTDPSNYVARFNADTSTKFYEYTFTEGVDGNIRVRFSVRPEATGSGVHTVLVKYNGTTLATFNYTPSSVQTYAYGDIIAATIPDGGKLEFWGTAPSLAYQDFSRFYLNYDSDNDTSITYTSASELFIYRSSAADLFAGTFTDTMTTNQKGLFQPKIDLKTKDGLNGTSASEVLFGDMMLFDLSLVFGGNGGDIYDTTSEISAKNVIQLIKSMSEKWYDFDYDAAKEAPSYQFISGTVVALASGGNGRNIRFDLQGVNDVIGGFDTCGYLPVKSYAVQYRKVGSELYGDKSPLFPADESVSMYMTGTLTDTAEFIQNGSTYQLRYQYTNGLGNSMASEAVFVETFALPDKVSNLTMQRHFDPNDAEHPYKLVLIWDIPGYDQNLPITGYAIKYGTNRNEATWTTIYITGTEFADPGVGQKKYVLDVDRNKVYYVKIGAYNGSS